MRVSSCSTTGTNDGPVECGRNPAQGSGLVGDESNDGPEIQTKNAAKRKPGGAQETGCTGLRL
jgi:hypothetical protein